MAADEQYTDEQGPPWIVTTACGSTFIGHIYVGGGVGAPWVVLTRPYAAFHHNHGGQAMLRLIPDETPEMRVYIGPGMLATARVLSKREATERAEFLGKQNLHEGLVTLRDMMDRDRAKIFDDPPKSKPSLRPVGAGASDLPGSTWKWPWRRRQS